MWDADIADHRAGARSKIAVSIAWPIKWRDSQVALPEGRDLGSDVLNDADELVGWVGSVVGFGLAGLDE